MRSGNHTDHNNYYTANSFDDLQMDMAQKVLSSDFNQLITAMKAAQKNANTFLEEVYQKEMLAAAHVVAKNSKLLFDAVVSCLRNARLR